MIVYNGVRQGWIDGVGREKIQKIKKKIKKNRDKITKSY